MDNLVERCAIVAWLRSEASETRRSAQSTGMCGNFQAASEMLKSAQEMDRLAFAIERGDYRSSEIAGLSKESE